MLSEDDATRVIAAVRKRHPAVAELVRGQDAGAELDPAPVAGPVPPVSYLRQGLALTSFASLLAYLAHGTP